MGMDTAMREYPRDYLCSWEALILPALTAIGGGSAAAGGATAAATLASVAGTATSIAAANKKPPSTEGITQAATPPNAAQASAAQADERFRIRQKAGFAKTILSNQLRDYGANPLGKSTLGG